MYVKLVMRIMLHTLYSNAIKRENVFPVLLFGLHVAVTPRVRVYTNAGILPAHYSNSISDKQKQ